MKSMMIVLIAGLLPLISMAQMDGDKPAQTQPVEVPQVPSIRDSSGGTNTSNLIGQVTNAATAAMNFEQAAALVGPCSSSGSACRRMATHIVMGIASVAQASAQKRTAKEAKSTFGFTDSGTNSPGTDSSGMDSSGDAYLEKMLSEQQKKIDQHQKFLGSLTGTEVQSGKPLAYDPKKQTITTASGQKFKLSDFSSPSAMAAAGMSKSTIDEAIASQKAIADKAAKLVSKYKLAGAGTAEESSGGGGSGSSAKATADDSLAGAGLGLGSTGLGIDRDPANLAGMQKNYNGEPIGVAGDSIFLMMTRRYKVKESQRSFYDESELLVGK